MSSTPPNGEYHFDLGDLLDRVHAEEEKELSALSTATPTTEPVGGNETSPMANTSTTMPPAVPVNFAGGGGGSQPTSAAAGPLLNQGLEMTPSKDPMADLHSWVRERTPNHGGTNSGSITPTPNSGTNTSYVTRASASSPLSNFAMATPPHAGRPVPSSNTAPQQCFTLSAVPGSASTGSLTGLTSEEGSSSLFASVGSPHSAMKPGSARSQPTVLFGQPATTGFDMRTLGRPSPPNPGGSSMVPPSPIRPGSGALTPQLLGTLDGGNGAGFPPPLLASFQSPGAGSRGGSHNPMGTPNSQGWTPSPIPMGPSQNQLPQQPSPIRGATPLDEQQQQEHFQALQGRMVEAAKDQAGCRVLQQFLDNPFDSTEVQAVLKEIMPSVAELMEHPYGNFLIQKLLDVAPDSVRLTITGQIAPHLPQVATTQHGTFAVQKLIESFRSSEERAVACKGLATNVTLLMTDGFGAHVVQKLLGCIPPANRQFLYDGIAANTVAICNHKHGCCVAQRCIEHGAQEQRALVLQAVVAEYSHLIVNPYGNYVMQFLMEHVPDATSVFVQRLVEHSDADIVFIATSKFGSNVVETALKRCSQEVASLLINKVCHLATLSALVMDRYGNYVIQTALQVSSPNSASVLVAALMPMLSQIRQQPYGRKFEGKLEAAMKRTSPADMGPEMMIAGNSPNNQQGARVHGQPPAHITQALASSPQKQQQPTPMPTQFHPFNAREQPANPTPANQGGFPQFIAHGGVPPPPHLLSNGTPFVPRAMPGQAPVPVATQGWSPQPQQQQRLPHQHQQQQQYQAPPLQPQPVCGAPPMNFTVYPSMVSPSPVKRSSQSPAGKTGAVNGYDHGGYRSLI